MKISAAAVFKCAAVYIFTSVHRFLNDGVLSSLMEQESSPNRKRKGVFVDDDKWRALKVHCAKNETNLVDKAGEIIEDWVTANIV